MTPHAACVTIKPDFFLVLPSQDGYVFRLQVAYHREPLILKEVVTPEGMLKYQDTEESRQLELETLHLPYLTSSLHG